MTESQRKCWILSHSRYSEVTCALRLLTKHIRSDQQTDLSDARMDFKDIKSNPS